LDWFTIQDWGVWSNGKHVTLRLPPRPSAEAVELVLRGVPAPGPAIRTRFVFGGQTMEAEIPPDATRTVVFPLPPAGPGYDPDMQIYPLGYAVVPEMPDPDRPDSVPAGQTRHIGVGLVAIHYLPALPPASAPGDAVGHQG
jgi:hypothetical protein